MLLPALLAFALVLVLFRARLGVVAPLVALAALVVACVMSLAMLPWQAAVTGWLVLGGLVDLAWRREMKRSLRRPVQARRHIRDFERQAGDSPQPFGTRVAARRRAFDLRCKRVDRQGFP